MFFNKNRNYLKLEKTFWLIKFAFKTIRMREISFNAQNKCYMKLGKEKSRQSK